MTTVPLDDRAQLRYLTNLFVTALTAGTTLAMKAKQAEVLDGDVFTAKRLFAESEERLEAANDLNILITRQMAEMIGEPLHADPVELATILQFPIRDIIRLNVEGAEEVFVARIADVLASPDFVD